MPAVAASDARVNDLPDLYDILREQDFDVSRSHDLFAGIGPMDLQTLGPCVDTLDNGSSPTGGNTCFVF